MLICTDLQSEIVRYLKAHDILYILKITDFPLDMYSKNIILNFRKNKNQNIDKYDYKYFKNAHICKMDFTLTNITDHDLKYLKNVNEINLSFTEITDHGLKYLKNVKIICLAFCKNISNCGLKHLKNIERLYVPNCPNIKITEKYMSARKHIKYYI